MTVKRYSIVSASTPSDLAEKTEKKIAAGWQPHCGPVTVTPFMLMQVVTAEGDVTDAPDDVDTGTDSDSGTDTSTDAGADTSTGTDTGADSDADTSDTATVTEVLSYRASEGWPADQGWTRKKGTAEVIDDSGAESGKALRMSKASDAGTAWELKKEMTSPVDLLTRGGVVSCRFKLEGTLTESQYAFGLYLVIPADALPDGVTLAESGAEGSNACLLAFIVQTDATNINLGWHQKSAVSAGTWGEFDNEWHTLELQFAGNNSTDVIPVLDGTAGDAVTLTKTAASTEENVFTITDITTGATYSTLFEYVTVDVNTEESATA